MASKKMACTCKHDFQDKTYGKGIRVHALCGPQPQKDCGCTVCGKITVGVKTFVVKEPEDENDTV